MSAIIKNDASNSFLDLDWDQPSRDILLNLTKSSSTFTGIRIITTASSKKKLEDIDIKEEEENRQLLIAISQKFNKLKDIVIDFRQAYAVKNGYYTEQPLPLRGLKELLEASQDTLENLVILSETSWLRKYDSWGTEDIMETLEPIGGTKKLRKLHIDAMFLRSFENDLGAFDLLGLLPPTLEDCKIIVSNKMEIYTDEDGFMDVKIHEFDTSSRCQCPNSIRCLDINLSEKQSLHLEELVAGFWKNNANLRSLGVKATTLADDDVFSDVSDLIKVLQTIPTSLESLKMEIWDPSRGMTSNFDTKEGMELASAIQSTMLQKLHISIHNGNGPKVNTLSPILFGLAQNESLTEFSLKIRNDQGSLGIEADLQEWESNLVENNTTLERFTLALVELDTRAKTTFALGEKSQFALKFNLLRKSLGDEQNQSAWMKALVQKREDTSIVFHLLSSNPSIFFSGHSSVVGKRGAVVLEPVQGKSKKAKLI